MSGLPGNLPPCDPCERRFPKPWKESYYRRHYAPRAGGYVCPGCGNAFRGTKGFELLQADHINPWSAGGLTVWENMVLLCGACNNRKSDAASQDEDQPQQAGRQGR